MNAVAKHQDHQATMTAWRVTHIDVDGTRRQLLVLAVSNERADALAVAVYGPGRGCQCIRLGKGR